MTGSPRRLPIDPWASSFGRSRLVLTADQDWAPEWATAELCNWAAEMKIPLHVYQTSPSAELSRRAADGSITLGAHPNLSIGSTQGRSLEKVLDHILRLVPGAVTARTHGFAESFSAWSAMTSRGMRFVSQLPTDAAVGLRPLVHATGAVLMPVWWEDDVWLRYSNRLSLEEALLERLAMPGMKILNVHPVHFALNTPSLQFYDDHRHGLYHTDGQLAPYSAGTGGVRDLVQRLAARAASSEIGWVGMHPLCTEIDIVIERFADILAPFSGSFVAGDSQNRLTMA